MVEGFTGRPGAGKTLNAVKACWMEKKAGRPIYSNIPLIDRRTKVRREFFFFGDKSIGPANERTYGKPWGDKLIHTLDEVYQIDNGRILLDEVHMWAPSQAWKDMPWELRWFLGQQRKFGVDIYWTAQSAGRVFNVIRELTSTEWQCMRYGPLTILKGVDPELKLDLGKKQQLCGPDIWQLYDTEFIVGSSDGKTQGRRGHNKQYDKWRDLDQVTAQEPRAGGRPLLRVVDRLGRVIYRLDDGDDGEASGQVAGGSGAPPRGSGGARAGAAFPDGRSELLEAWLAGA